MKLPPLVSLFAAACSSVAHAHELDGRQFLIKIGEALEIFSCNADGSDIRQVTKLGKISTPPAWSPDGKWISFRHTDERYWSNPKRMKKIYAEHPGDKRPVWIIHPDGTDAQLVEVTRFGCAMDGSRAQWKPTLSK